MSIGVKIIDMNSVNLFRDLVTKFVNWHSQFAQDEVRGGTPCNALRELVRESQKALHEDTQATAPEEPATQVINAGEGEELRDKGENPIEAVRRNLQVTPNQFFQRYNAGEGINDGSYSHAGFDG